MKRRLEKQRLRGRGGAAGGDGVTEKPSSKGAKEEPWENSQGKSSQLQIPAKLKELQAHEKTFNIANY